MSFFYDSNVQNVLRINNSFVKMCCLSATFLEVNIEYTTAAIPEDTDVLVTHAPPYGIPDRDSCILSVAMA